MDLDFAVEKKKTHYRVAVTGEPSHDRLVALVHVLGVQSEAWPVRRVAFDLRHVRTNFSQEERFRAGMELGSSFAHMHKVAVIVPPGPLTGTGVIWARKNGLNAQSFRDEAEALRWLLQD